MSACWKVRSSRWSSVTRCAGRMSAARDQSTTSAKGSSVSAPRMTGTLAASRHSRSRACSGAEDSAPVAAGGGSTRHQVARTSRARLLAASPHCRHSAASAPAPARVVLPQLKESRNLSVVPLSFMSCSTATSRRSCRPASSDCLSTEERSRWPWNSSRYSLVTGTRGCSLSQVWVSWSRGGITIS